MAGSDSNAFSSLHNIPEIARGYEIEGLIDELDRLVVAVMDKMDRAFLTRCYWSDPCECREMAVVNDLNSGQEFCEEHFVALVALRAIAPKVGRS